MAVSLRASDADRERVAEQLGRKWCEGYLSFETFSERVERVYRARSHRQLGDLVRDLPLGLVGGLKARRERTRGTLPDEVAPGQGVAELALPDDPRVSLLLGRAADCTHRFADDTVSRYHAHVSSEHGVCVLADLDSTNGLYLNGRRVWRAALRAGDHLGLGGASVLVTAGSLPR